MGIEIRAAREQEAEAVRDLIALAFDAETYGPSINDPPRDVGSSSQDPHHRGENTRILLVDGRVVSVIQVLRRQAYAMGQLVRVGWISMVATHPDFRRQGHMRRLMAATQDFMRERGLSYCGMMGAQSFYAGSLGWRSWSAKLPTLPRKYVSPAIATAGHDTRVGAATSEDISFLSALYAERNANRFGPVVRSHDYWRRWSLLRPWEGVYVVARTSAGPFGYFHMGGSTVDEIAWDTGAGDSQRRTLLAAAYWAAEHGHECVQFYGGAMSEAEATLLPDTLIGTESAYANPLGQTVSDPDPSPYRAMTGVLVRFLAPGPGILSQTDCTDSLVQTMARHAWYYYDGDSS
jgi:GNAT superfamily N-acetyltransferase